MLVSLWSGSALRRATIGSCAIVAVSSVSTLFAAESATPKTSAARKAAATALLEEALIAEVDGRGEDRVALLAKAEALAPDLPAIQWQRGMVLVDGKWIPAEDVAVSSEDRALLDEYVAKRADASQDAAADQLELANWCQEKRLYEQERAHLSRSLKFEPDNPRARTRLGYVRVDDEWVSREEVAHALVEQAWIQASLTRYCGDLETVVKSLSDERKSVRERAVETIRSFRDVNAIPALERIVASESDESAKLVLEALAQMPEKEASLSIARFAALSPSFRVRREARELLQEREFDHFVPAILATMRGPVESSYSLERRLDARLVYRQTFYREAMGSADAIVKDFVYANSQPSLSPDQDGDAHADPAFGWFKSKQGGRLMIRTSRNDRIVAAAAADDATLRSELAEMEVTFENGETRNLNAPLGEALSAVTGEDFGSDAPAWWNWWARYNGLSESGAKPVDVQYGQSWQSVGKEQNAQRARIAHVLVRQIDSCFAAGTPVLTSRGDVAIDQVRVGDLVLAQDVETGELAFKPVLETTVRPPAEILRIEYEGGSLRSTGGHPFWVSGEGWVHARRLQSGMELHTPTGTVRVSQVVSDGQEPAYNLIVADFANYFVGEARILSHDNSSRTPTDAIVPGLAQR